MSSTAAEQNAVNLDEFSPTLRDLARRCAVSHLFGNFYMVRTDSRHAYRVKAEFVDQDFVATCQCPIFTVKKQQCRHALAAVMFKRSTLARAQFGD
jgi:hypothetical protein